jgi:hypothetical protein
MLVFGNSDTRGAAVDCPTWTELVRAELSQRDELEFVDRNFVPLGPGAPRFAEGLVTEACPDALILPLSEYVFWAVSVELQVRRRLGSRVAGAFKRTERRFDRFAAGGPGIRGASHRAVQSVIRRTVGTRAAATAAEVAATYGEVIRRLARIEELDVVVVSYPLSPLPALQSPKMRAARAGFIRDVRASAERHHMHWVDGDELVARAGLNPESAYAPDGVHIGTAAHPLYAAAVLDALSHRQLGGRSVRA